MTFSDPRSTTTRLQDTFAEAFDDLGNAAIDEIVLTADEAAEMVVKQLDEWLLYYGNRYTFYCKLKDAIKQRICTA